tara:strand:+ start:299 stop:496 length:198 start_codon:yes stop_codon:yes gene_type:complete
MSKEKLEGLFCPKGFRWSFKQGTCVRKRSGLRKGALGRKKIKTVKGDKDKKGKGEEAKSKNPRFL